MLKNNNHKVEDLKAHVREEHPGKSKCSALIQAHSCPLQFAKGPKNILQLALRFACKLELKFSFALQGAVSNPQEYSTQRYYLETDLLLYHITNMSVLVLSLSPFLLIEKIIPENYATYSLIWIIVFRVSYSLK